MYYQVVDHCYPSLFGGPPYLPDYSRMGPPGGPVPYGGLGSIIKPPKIKPINEWFDTDIPPFTEWEIPPVTEWNLNVPNWMKKKAKIFPDNIGNPCIPGPGMAHTDFPFYGEIMLPEYRVVKCNTLLGYCMEQRISYFLPKLRVCYSRNIEQALGKTLLAKVKSCVDYSLKLAAQRFTVTLGVSSYLFGTTITFAIRDAFDTFQNEFFKCLSRIREGTKAMDYMQFSIFAWRTPRTGQWSR